ncbi:MAG: winged helix-turn-helix transcriptional regulator [Burkholderiales bacterium]|jgi:DNA-binding MarR family transcriptional regulator|nr:winged helix-turn-helix transcriptional regulator [Burkholderiales bacterium]
MTDTPKSLLSLPQFAECNASVLRQAARAIGQLYDGHLAQAGLRGGQFSLLSRLRREGAMGVNALAAAAGMDRTTLSRVLKPLERDGLVEGVISPADRRARLLKLTALGEARFVEALPHWEAAQAAFETAYGVDEAARLRAMLRLMAPGGAASLQSGG